MLDRKLVAPLNCNFRHGEVSDQFMRKGPPLRPYAWPEHALARTSAPQTHHGQGGHGGSSATTMCERIRRATAREKYATRYGRKKGTTRITLGVSWSNSSNWRGRRQPWRRRGGAGSRRRPRLCCEPVPPSGPCDQERVKHTQGRVHSNARSRKAKDGEELDGIGRRPWRNRGGPRGQIRRRRRNLEGGKGS